MDDTKRDELISIGDEAIDLMELVEAAYDEHATFSQKYQTRIKVEDLVARFRERMAPLDPIDRETIERTVGRRVADLQKFAVRLPAPPSGKPVEKKVDHQFWETREGKSSRQPITIGAAPGAPRAGEGPKYRVTGEIEAWCGPCNEMKTHVIAAMVGDQPAQVVCQACGKTHKYRDTPPDKKKPAPRAAAGPYKPSAAEMEAQKKAKEKSALIDQLQAAEKVRAYSPKERYKAGEIIEHPEFGRGKIENTLPRSLMVRFPAGLKTLKLG